MVGSGVTGAEFASAYQALGSQVTLVSSRERVLPHEDADAADGGRGRVPAARDDRAEPVAGARRSSGPATAWWSRWPTAGRCAARTACSRWAWCRTPAAWAWRRPGSRSTTAGSSRWTGCPGPSAPGVYAAGDCTGVLMLASVAAMQGRIAMWHALGEAVQPMRLDHVAATIFTDPEIATVGVTAGGRRVGRRRRGGGQAAAGHQRAGEDAGLPGRVREAVRPPPRPGWCSAGWWSRRGPAS